MWQGRSEAVGQVALRLGRGSQQGLGLSCLMVHTVGHSWLAERPQD